MLQDCPKEHASFENVFVSEVDESFEDEINVLEGEYGRFLSESELKAEIEETILFNRVVRSGT
jgi:hypothetical protein